MYDYMNDPNLTEEEKKDLNEEAEGSLSRSERIEAAESELGQKKAKRFFDFDRDADDGKIYGIDVSHYNENINWNKIANAGAKFAYIKATQGTTVVDKYFEKNIKESIENGIPSGAYHFLSSLSPASTQADNLINIYSKWHEKCKLPLVIDIEWDKKNGNSMDRWKRKKPDEIVEMAQILIERIEKEFNIVPLIYTNKSWWKDMLGAEGDILNKYPLWMSRYGGYNEDKPPIMNGFTWQLWQFTDEGSINGIKRHVDVNWCKPGFLAE